MFIKAGSHINIELNIELECFVLKLQNFTLNQNKTFLFDIELNIEGLKACLNEPLLESTLWFSLSREVEQLLYQVL